MLTKVVDATTDVVMLNVALALPCGIVTLEGTDAAALFDEPNAIVTPPEGALPLRETVPVDGEPPTTVEGLTVTLDRTAVVIVRVAFALEAPRVAVILTVVGDGTEVVVTWKVAVDCPGTTVTVWGTVALVLSLARLMTMPWVPLLGPLSVIVPVVGEPPPTLLGFNVRLVIAGAM